MITNIRNAGMILFALLIGFSSCKKTEYSFGDIKTPSGLTLTAVVEGVDGANPNGNGSGYVLITTSGTGALTYKIDFGDGNSQIVPTGTIRYKYASPGTNSFLISVNAIGTGGAISTISKQMRIFVAFEIPLDILQSLTDGSSKIWVTDNDAPGHFGVGANNSFWPNYYAATPNSREACAYDDEITISKDVINRVSMNVNNKGQSFSIGAATSFYGFGGGDGCYGINTGGTKLLAFMNSTSGSTPADSRQIEFVVPGNGIINFGTGGTKYEILAVTATSLYLRNIGADGNSWYQKLKKKP